MAPRKKKLPDRPTLEGTIGLVIFLSWLHGSRATLRGIGEACIAIADEPPIVLLTGKQLGAILSLASLEGQ